LRLPRPGSRYRGHRCGAVRLRPSSVRVASGFIDQLRQGGALLNPNRFLLRRGRIRVTRDWDYASLLVELDGNTTRGPTMRIQKAELSLLYGR